MKKQRYGVILKLHLPTAFMRPYLKVCFIKVLDCRQPTTRYVIFIEGFCREEITIPENALLLFTGKFSITVHLPSCLTGLDSSSKLVLNIKEAEHRNPNKQRTSLRGKDHCTAGLQYKAGFDPK